MHMRRALISLTSIILLLSSLLLHLPPHPPAFLLLNIPSFYSSTYLSYPPLPSVPDHPPLPSSTLILSSPPLSLAHLSSPQLTSLVSSSPLFPSIHFLCLSLTLFLLRSPPPLLISLLFHLSTSLLHSTSTYPSSPPLSSFFLSSPSSCSFCLYSAPSNSTWLPCAGLTLLPHTSSSQFPTPYAKVLYCRLSKGLSISDALS